MARDWGSRLDFGGILLCGAHLSCGNPALVEDQAVDVVRGGPGILHRGLSVLSV